jgi:hypothetical protein
MLCLGRRFGASSRSVSACPICGLRRLLRVSLATMTAIPLLPKLDCTKAFWMRTVGTEIFRP